jgi:hypothetical protein
MVPIVLRLAGLIQPNGEDRGSGASPSRELLFDVATEARLERNAGRRATERLLARASMPADAGAAENASTPTRLATTTTAHFMDRSTRSYVKEVQQGYSEKTKLILKCTYFVTLRVDLEYY